MSRIQRGGSRLRVTLLFRVKQAPPRITVTLIGSLATQGMLLRLMAGLLRTIQLLSVNCENSL
ncbi:hypothetical protein JHK82_038894 [Glycine max]|nr:hypothetical protein JHK87_038864 [Glycine soja]KAG4962204.1 hypothetical protein JHK86_039072 [Glycine max]KAG5109671.1 hypothetical protein JHK82_038894 [Glycine max]